MELCVIVPNYITVTDLLPEENDLDRPTIMLCPLVTPETVVPTLPHYFIAAWSFPGYRLAVLAVQRCTEVTLLLKIVELLFTATALPCLRRCRKLVAVTLRVCHG